MANSLTAFLERSRVPDRQALQEEIKRLKFRLSIDESWVPFECSGYIPCTLDGEDAGFDVRFEDGSSRLPDSLSDEAGKRDAALVLKWGGDPRERASALIVCAALSQGFDALILHQGEETFRSSPLDEARKAFEQLQE